MLRREFDTRPKPRLSLPPRSKGRKRVLFGAVAGFTELLFDVVIDRFLEYCEPVRDELVLLVSHFTTYAKPITNQRALAAYHQARNPNRTMCVVKRAHTGSNVDKDIPRNVRAGSDEALERFMHYEHLGRLSDCACSTEPCSRAARASMTERRAFVMGLCSRARSRSTTPKNIDQNNS